MFEKESIEKMKRCSGWAISSREAIVALVGECGFILTTISILSCNEDCLLSFFVGYCTLFVKPPILHRCIEDMLFQSYIPWVYRDDSVLCFERGNFSLLIQVSPVLSSDWSMRTLRAS